MSFFLVWLCPAIRRAAGAGHRRLIPTNLENAGHLHVLISTAGIIPSLLAASPELDF
jgi:hypothetical protein